MDRAQLEDLVEAGFTVRQGRTAVAGAEPERRYCRKHGVVEFVRRHGEGTFRCRKCRAEQVSNRRRKVKAILVEEAGGRCQMCGYDRYQGALQFHHVDPETKRFHLSLGGLTQSIQRLREEAQKCILLCANCHAEVEGGAATVL